MATDAAQINESGPDSSCESCGRTESGLAKVQRVYVMPEDSSGSQPDDATEGGSSRAQDLGEHQATAADIELWCASCRATFPHVEIEIDESP